MGKPKKIRITGHTNGDGDLCCFFTKGKVYDVLFWDRKTGNIPRIRADDGTERWLVNTIWQNADETVDAAIELLEDFICDHGDIYTDNVLDAIKILKNLPRP